MTEIINLRRARKEKQRLERSVEAEANRQRFGRTKAQKARDRDAQKRADQELDSKRLERNED